MRIPLRGRDGSVVYATIDDEDAEYVCQFRWSKAKIGNHTYVTRRDPKRGTLYLHRELLNAPKGMHVDHINRDTLDNRRSNLRLATNAQNRQNQRKRRDAKTSKHRGVSWQAERGKWLAQVTVNGKHHTRRFDDEGEAAAYARELRAKLMTHATD